MFESYGITRTANRVTLEARKAELGGAWGPWYVVNTIEKNTGAIWEVFGSSGTPNGDFDYFYYRVQFIGGAGRSIRNIQLTVIEVAR